MEKLKLNIFRLILILGLSALLIPGQGCKKDLTGNGGGYAGLTTDGTGNSAPANEIPDLSGDPRSEAPTSGTAKDKTGPQDILYTCQLINATVDGQNLPLIIYILQNEMSEYSVEVNELDESVDPAVWNLALKILTSSLQVSETDISGEVDLVLTTTDGLVIKVSGLDPAMASIDGSLDIYDLSQAGLSCANNTKDIN